MTVFNLLLYTHVFGGGLSLLLGTLVLVLKKGDKRHKLIGRLYFFSLLTASLIAIPMSILHPNYFLFIISIFTIYMLITGWRYLSKKGIQDVQKTDWILTFTILLFGLAFIGFGIMHLLKSNIFGIVFIVFGLVCWLFGYQDFKEFSGKSNLKNGWLIMHLQRMIGSYIASATAFLVVNNTILPSVIAWLLPTIIIVPLMIKWSRKLEVKN